MSTYSTRKNTLDGGKTAIVMRAAVLGRAPYPFIPSPNAAERTARWLKHKLQALRAKFSSSRTKPGAGASHGDGHTKGPGYGHGGPGDAGVSHDA